MKDTKLHSILTIFKGVLMVLGFVFGILLMLQGTAAVLGPGHIADEEKTLKENVGIWEGKLASAADENEKLAINSHIDAINSNISFNSKLTFSMNLTIYMIYGGLIFAILFAVYLTFIDLRNNIPFLVGIAIFGAIVLFSWVTASDAMIESWKYRDPELFNPGFVKFSDFSIKLVSIFGLLAVVLIAAGWVWGLVKRFSA